jgi:hypothetical protein
MEAAFVGQIFDLYGYFSRRSLPHKIPELRRLWRNVQIRTPHERQMIYVEAVAHRLTRLLVSSSLVIGLKVRAASIAWSRTCERSIPVMTTEVGRIIEYCRAFVGCTTLLCKI